jgi:hypothetical protein
MHRADAIAWVVSVCSGCLRRSQAKTLAALVAAALRAERVSLANLGRQMLGGVKHQVKRCWRFCANERIEAADAMRGVVGRVLRRRRRRPLLVALDWTDVRQVQSLVASAVLRGRSAPLCWASCARHVYDGHRSRNAFEESLLLVLRSMVPAGQKVILLADRGFGRTELARFCQRHGFEYVVRIQPNVHVRCAGFSGKLLDHPVRRGACKLLTGVAYRAHHPVTQNVVVRWVRGLPPKRDECWFLMTSLAAGPARVSRLYGLRMTAEQWFRDAKNRRNGWSLRDTGLTRADRLDRPLLVLAIAYLLLCGLGLVARQTRRPGDWSASSKDDCSAFTAGRVMLHRLDCSAARAARALIDATEDVVPNWG